MLNSKPRTQPMSVSKFSKPMFLFFLFLCVSVLFSCGLEGKEGLSSSQEGFSSSQEKSLSSPNTQKMCEEYYRNKVMTPKAKEWCENGQYFQVPYAGKNVHVFGNCVGEPSKPALLMIHGWPTSSFDFSELVENMKKDYRVCFLDTPGYGFSEKPRTADFHYSIFEDIQVVEHFVTKIAKLSKFALLTHDKGDSVGLAFLKSYNDRTQTSQETGFTISHHVMLNGSIWLKYATLSNFQTALRGEKGATISKSLTGDLLAKMMSTQYDKMVSKQEEKEWGSVFDFQDGTDVLYKTIEYLNERDANEIKWLEALRDSPVPLRMIWGQNDEIANQNMVKEVWNQYLTVEKGRTAPASLWLVPCANHYIQNDAPVLVASLVRSFLENQPSNNQGFECQPSLYGSHP